PLLLDGVADRFGFAGAELALASASHSSEPLHLEAIARFMEKAGVREAELACGPHTPLSPAVAEAVIRDGVAPTPRWSNCSGKHTGMLALARHHGWPREGYNAVGHPVQDRILDEVCRWTGADRDAIRTAPDGCTAACFALPLRNMALGYARLAASTEAAPRRLLEAMMGHPFLIAGTGRLCTDLMSAWPGRVVAKVGAEGVYCAALPEWGLGVALKVEDGSTPASAVALLEILRQVLARVGVPGAPEYRFEGLSRHAVQPIINTRGVVTGALQPAGELRFFDE
ncbi:MAG TPA: asparaginase, partial [Gemmatimonadales bacterium]